MKDTQQGPAPGNQPGRSAGTGPSATDARSGGSRADRGTANPGAASHKSREVIEAARAAIHRTYK